MINITIALLFAVKERIFLPLVTKEYIIGPSI